MEVIIVPTDTIDLLITAAMLGFRPDDSRASAQPRQILELADRYGQSLVDENHASVSAARGTSFPAPRYEWTPVFDLLWRDAGADLVTDEQALQLERSQLLVVENSREHDGWEGSLAERFMDRLATALSGRLRDWPLEADPDNVGVIEHRGLSSIDGRWTRESPNARTAGSTNAGARDDR